MASDAYLKALTKNKIPINLNDWKNRQQHEDWENILHHKLFPSEIREFREDSGKRGWVLPFDKYLGPGNSINQGVPNSAADAIAEKHDLEYADIQWKFKHGLIDERQAKNAIASSDINAIHEFGKSGTFAGVVGHDGLQIKHLFEKVAGHTYPNFDRHLFNQMSTGKRQGNRREGISKLARIEDNNVSSSQSSGAATGHPTPSSSQASTISSESSQAPVQQANISTTDLQKSMKLTGTGKEQASGGASSEGLMAYEIERPLTLFGRKQSIYTKSHKFMTFGLASSLINQVPSEGATYLTTYLAEVPWHIPAFFLNPSEFALINSSAYVKMIKVEIFYRGSVVQFQTASSTSALATLNQINDIAVAYGLNKSGQGHNFNPREFSETQPMIVTTLGRPIYAPVAGIYRGMVRDYYGSNNDTADFRNDIPKHQIGRQTFLYNYFALTATGLATPPQVNTLQTGGFPCLTEKIEQYDGKTVVNTKVGEIEYMPKMAPIKPPLRTIGHGTPVPRPGVDLNISVNTQLIQGRTAQLVEDGPVSSGGYTPVATEISSTTDVPAAPVYTIYTPIEKSQYLRTGYWGDMEAHAQPSVHIGIQPVPALTTAAILIEDNQFNNWTDTRGYWEVKATMVVQEYQPTAYPHANSANVPFGDNILQVDTIPVALSDPRNDGATFCGLYTNRSGAF